MIDNSTIRSLRLAAPPINRGQPEPEAEAEAGPGS